MQFQSFLHLLLIWHISITANLLVYHTCLCTTICLIFSTRLHFLMFVNVLMLSYVAHSSSLVKTFVSASWNTFKAVGSIKTGNGRFHQLIQVYPDFKSFQTFKSKKTRWTKCWFNNRSGKHIPKSSMIFITNCVAYQF